LARWPRAGSVRGGKRDVAALQDPGSPNPMQDDDARRARLDALKPEPLKVGGVAEAPSVRLPEPATLFAAQAERFDSLAADHELGDYLRFLAGLARLQHAVQGATAASRPVTADTVRPLEPGVPPLSPADLCDDADYAVTLHLILAGIADLAAPSAARQAAARLLAMSATEKIELSSAVFTGLYPAEQLGECLFVAAALQVSLSRRAATLDASTLLGVDASVCPACGSAPVASLVVGWTRAAKARYCRCSLCATQWNHVRIKCTSCGSTAGIQDHGIAELSENVAVETCDACHSYIKHMQQNADPLLDPVADDIASYGLDVLIRGEGYRRGGINPFFVLA